MISELSMTPSTSLHTSLGCPPTSSGAQYESIYVSKTSSISLQYLSTLPFEPYLSLIPLVCFLFQLKSSMGGCLRILPFIAVAVISP